MQRNFETSFVTQCAPVLAGLKVANLFRWVEPDASAMHAMAERWAAELKPKGVTVSMQSQPATLWAQSWQPAEQSVLRCSLHLEQIAL